MAKIDVTKIEGYSDMTPEQKLAALEGFDIPDPDYSGYVKKDVFDKTASELAAKKKELTEKMTEDEQKKQKEQEERDELQSKYEKLLHESEVSKFKAKLLSMGYDEKLADDTAEAMANGDNLPLELDGEIVGVIGITGSYDEVINSGRLLKKMTEILLMEQRESYHQLMDKRVRNAFFEEWLISTGYVNYMELKERGHALNIDIDRPRRIFIVSVLELDQYKETQEGQSKIQKMETCVDKFLRDYDFSIHFRNTSRQIILVDRCSTKELTDIADKLNRYVYEKTKLELCVGIDGDERDMHVAYQQAHRAWRSAADENQKVVCYENLSLEIILSCVPPEQKMEYLNKLFKECSQDEIREYITMLGIYFRTEGSINKTAELMYIHKNTLQYRLNKLKELTGYDVRKPSESAALYMAMRIAYDIDN